MRPDDTGEQRRTTELGGRTAPGRARANRLHAFVHRPRRPVLLWKLPAREVSDADWRPIAVPVTLGALIVSAGIVYYTSTRIPWYGWSVGWVLLPMAIVAGPFFGPACRRPMAILRRGGLARHIAVGVITVTGFIAAGAMAVGIRDYAE